MQVSCDRVAQKREYGTVLLLTGADDGEDPLAPALASGTACSLRQSTVDGDKPNRLFGEVICRFNSRRGEKAKIRVGMREEPLADVPAPGRVHSLVDSPQKVRTGVVQMFLKALFGFVLLPAMDDCEHASEATEEFFAVSSVSRVRMRGQEFDIADQMRQTELHRDAVIQPHVLAIRTEVIVIA